MDLMIWFLGSLETTAVNTVCSVSMENLLNTKRIINVLIIVQTVELARNTTLIHYHWKQNNELKDAQAEGNNSSGW